MQSRWETNWEIINNAVANLAGRWLISKQSHQTAVGNQICSSGKIQTRDAKRRVNNKPSQNMVSFQRTLTGLSGAGTGQKVNIAEIK